MNVFWDDTVYIRSTMFGYWKAFIQALEWVEQVH